MEPTPTPNLVSIPDTSFTCVCKLCQRTVHVTARVPRDLAKSGLPEPIIGLMQLAAALSAHLQSDHPSTAQLIGSVASNIAGTLVFQCANYTGPNGGAVEQLMSADIADLLRVMSYIPLPIPPNVLQDRMQHHRETLMAIGVDAIDAEQLTRNWAAVITGTLTPATMHTANNHGGVV